MLHISVLMALGASTPPAADFDTRFTGLTLRFDYYHAGTAAEEHIAPDQFRIEGQWPGSRTQLLDDTNLGKYSFEVVDLATNLVVYTRGFASIYGEWETTGEAKSTWKSFHESQRFPEPRAKAQLVLKKRADDGTFREIFSTVVDPESRFVNRAPLTPRGVVWDLFDNGPSARKVDLLVMSEGYTQAEREKFKRDVTRLSTALFDTEPFRSKKEDFNLRALFVPAAESGISNPRKNVWRDSPLGLSFNAFDSDRYVLTYANTTVREIAAQAPYDALILVFNERKYGGGGIFNLWATCAADTEPSAYIFVHEFGHSFAGLADEYYSSQVAYEAFAPPGSEPWEPNVTALLDPARLKWRDLVEASTPLPTPWEQDAYDKVDLAYQQKRKQLIDARSTEEASEALMREIKETTTPMLRGEKYYGKVGAFQGAAYQARGLYRPEADCIMFTRNPTSFCKVCARALEKVIGLYTR